MNTPLVFARNHATVDEAVWHLQQCAAAFVPALDSRVDIAVYAEKLVHHAACFEAWSAHVLVGLVAAYLNNQAQQHAFISNVSVLPSYQSMGIATSLLVQCLEQSKAIGFKRVELEVGSGNPQAIHLYLKIGFLQQMDIDKTNSIRMYKIL